MKRVLIGIGALLAVLTVGVLVAPSFIDWNSYRTRIAAQASTALGRTVEIRGDVALSLLPSPVLSIRDAHLANVEGAAESDMASLGLLEVHFALMPLLVGDVRIESVKLIHPTIDLEVMDNGRTNTVFEPLAGAPATPGGGVTPPPAKAAAPADALSAGASVAAGFDVRVDSFVVEKGTLVLRNAPRGLVERIENLNGRFALASLKGPLDAIGSAVVRGVPLSFEGSTGAVIQGRTMPINLDVAVIPGKVRVQFSGFLNGLNDVLKLTGKVALDGQNLRDFAAALGAGLPDVLARPFGVDAGVTASVEVLELANLAVKLDTQQLTGRLAATLGQTPTAEVALAATKFDLDALLAVPTAAIKPAPSSAPVPTASGTLALPEPEPAPPLPKDAKFSLELLPAALSVNLNVSVDALTAHGAQLRQAKASLALANREITISQVSALLPGAADAALFGFVTEKDGTPQFDGTLETSTNDLRGTLDWLGVPVHGLNAERLRRLAVNARLSLRQGMLSIPELHAKLDGSDIDGAATVVLRDRPSLGVNLIVDRLNLDGYLPARGPTPTTPARNESAAAPSPTATAPSSSSSSSLSSPWAMLGGFDANVRARVGALTYDNLPFNDVRFEASLVDGTADIKSFTVGDLVGVSGGLSGSISGLKANSEPTFKDLVFQAGGKSVVPLLRLSGLNLGLTPGELGAVRVSARLNGALRALEMAGDLEAASGRAGFEGKVQTTDLLPRVVGTFSASHPDLVKLARLFASDYRPARAKGGLDLSGKLNASPLEIALTDLVGTVGGVTMQGGAAINLLGVRPKIAAQFVTGDLDIDAFLPVKRIAQLDSPIRPASFIVPEGETPASYLIRVATGSTGRWSTDPIDLSALRVIDGAFTVKSDSLKYGGFTLANSDLEAELVGGALNLRKLTGKTMGGTFTLDGLLANDASGAKFEGRYALQGADVGAAERAMGGRGATKGDMALDGALSGNGRSMADLIGSLAGEGTVALKGVDVGDGAGAGFAAVGALMQQIDRLASVGGGKRAGLIDLSGPYKVNNGIVSFDKLAFAAAVGDGTAHGTADLPKWQLEAKGEVKLSKGLIAELTTKDGDAKPLPFELSGPLDAPRVKLDIAKLPGGALRIPNPKELLNKIAPKMAPAPAPSASATPAPTPDAAPAPDQPSAKSRVDDVIKNIVKGFKR